MKTNLLIGSLSNDLFRVASLVGRGSERGAQKFLLEAQKWALELAGKTGENYITRIVQEISRVSNEPISQADAEKYLMYSVLLQNYSLHAKK